MKWDSEKAFEREMHRLMLETQHEKLKAAQAEREREELMLECVGASLADELGEKTVRRIRKRLAMARQLGADRCAGCSELLGGDSKVFDGLRFHEGCLPGERKA